MHTAPAVPFALILCRRVALALACLLAILATPATARAQEVIPLAFGPNSLDIDGDGRMDLIVKGWRESYNGNGYLTYQVLMNSGPDRPIFPELRAAERGAKTPVRTGDLWELVLIFDPVTERYQPLLQELESGNCNLKAATFLRDKDGIVLLVADKRDAATIFDSLPITIEAYTLKRNTGEVPGEPALAFRRISSTKTKTDFCDAQLALDSFVATLKAQ